jgi:hypothetical protein
MKFPPEQVDMLKKVYPNVQEAEEAGISYFLLPELDMPDGCIPVKTDALFCPMTRDGYPSRLFLSVKLSGCPERNWNFQGRILDRTWYAISWKLSLEQNLIQLLRAHLDAFRP